MNNSHDGPPLSEAAFWDLIQQTARPGDSGEAQTARLQAVLAPLSENELLGVYHFWTKLSWAANSGDLWAVAYTVMGGCSDDGFDYFRHWLICQGQAVYVAALADPDSLCDVFEQIPEGDMPQGDDQRSSVRRVFEAQFPGRDFYATFDTQTHYPLHVEHPSLQLRWEGEDEESLRAVCPRTVAKWLDNDRF